MEYIFRQAKVSDFDQCIELLASPWLCDPSQQPALREMWREIVQSRCGIHGVILEAQQPSVVLGFFFMVFVPYHRVKEYHECRRPLISRRLLADWVARRHPFLDADEVARTNAAEGVNCVVTHYGRRWRRPDSRAHLANYELSRSVMRGWNMRSLTIEIFTDANRNDREYGRSLGYRVLEYPPQVLRAAGIPHEQRPFLWLATRDEEGGKPAYGTAVIFQAPPRPRFAFAPLEQQLLTLSLEGATDTAMAHELGISVATVKKHFRGIHERVAAVAVLDAPLAEALLDHERRSPQMRRRLLKYLRDHPEELRPYSTEKC
ncbi:MAG: hypothetical protein JO030_04535 [Candidatus Eremiobacteraeota bacterium]|nr:hypothetical protein [Candidatus Eremiobacteraeota bacterium]